jgi:hypothetical protein
MKIAMLINQSKLLSHRIELNFMDLSLCISRFLILKISCSALTFKQRRSIQRSQKIVWRVPGQGPSSRPQNQMQKKPKSAPNDDSWYVPLKNVDPKNFVIKCVPNRDAYLNGCVLKWEATVFIATFSERFIGCDRDKWCR